MRSIRKHLLHTVSLLAFGVSASASAHAASGIYWAPQNGSESFFDAANWTGGSFGPEGYGTFFDKGNAYGDISIQSSPINMAEQIGYGSGNEANIFINIIEPQTNPPNFTAESNAVTFGNKLLLGSSGGKGNLTLKLTGNGRLTFRH